MQHRNGRRAGAVSDPRRGTMSPRERTLRVKMRTRAEIERAEDLTLAPWAMRSARSEGRAHAEAEHPYRTIYQRDRDRIVHCTAFRRLEYKTQVFVNSEGD